jgi:acetyl esterase
MALDPNVKQLLDQMVSIGAPPVHTLTVEQARASMDSMVALMGQGEEVGHVEDRTIDAGGQQLPVRIYRPVGVSTDAAPALVFYHGGGFVLGGLATHDRDCRALANRGQCVVIAVDYRLAPEHPFPAAADDAVAALEYIVTHAAELGVDAEHLAVGGDSAGGNLAAVTALHARDAGIPLKLQLLIYPAVASTEGDFPSRIENASGYMLDEESITWFTAAYFPDGAPQDWRAAPMLAASHEGVAPALIITAEYDPLRDEGEAYAEALRAAGVAVTATRYDGVIHGFFSFPDMLPEGKAVIDEACQALRAALA